MAFVANVDFSSALARPAALSAVLLSTLKRLLAEEGSQALAQEVISISEKSGVVAIRVSWPLVASALSLRKSKIEEVFGDVLARFGRKYPISVRIR